MEERNGETHYERERGEKTKRKQQTTIRTIGTWGTHYVPSLPLYPFSPVNVQALLPKQQWLNNVQKGPGTRIERQHFSAVLPLVSDAFVASECVFPTFLRSLLFC